MLARAAGHGISDSSLHYKMLKGEGSHTAHLSFSPVCIYQAVRTGKNSNKMECKKSWF